jgi:hypothetical protein
MGNAASGGWENHCMVGKHMHIANLFLKDLYTRGKFSLKSLLVA